MIGQITAWIIQQKKHHVSPIPFKGKLSCSLMKHSLFCQCHQVYVYRGSVILLLICICICYIVDTIVLYTNWLSACSHRVAIALQEANIEHERIDIDLYNKPVWFKDVNPNLMVPVLKSEGQYIYESSIINEYLNDRFPEKK